MKAYRGSRGITHSFLTSALDGGEWLIARSGRFIPVKGPQYSLNRRLDGPRSRSGFGKEKNSLLLPGFEPRPLQPIASHYTDSATPLLAINH
jgi:hypothetical protein